MLVIKYVFFAIVSTLFNILFQYITFSSYNGPFSLYVAMTFGTLAGLLSKYYLDKKFIFYHATKNRQDETKKFVLYSFFGIFTTLIFWGTEIAFDILLKAPFAKYVGAILGLGVGYVIKYFMDKRYVFVCREDMPI